MTPLQRVLDYNRTTEVELQLLRHRTSTEGDAAMVRGSREAIKRSRELLKETSRGR